MNNINFASHAEIQFFPRIFWNQQSAKFEKYGCDLNTGTLVVVIVNLRLVGILSLLRDVQP